MENHKYLKFDIKVFLVVAQPPNNTYILVINFTCSEPVIKNGVLEKNLKFLFFRFYTPHHFDTGVSTVTFQILIEDCRFIS